MYADSEMGDREEAKTIITSAIALKNFVGIAPTIDAVPVVRCKDCKHWLKDVAGCTEHVGRCEWVNWMIGENGYCVYGERKEAQE